VTRDLDLVRDLLVRTEREQFTTEDPNLVYHAALLKEAGLVEAVITPKIWRGRFTLAIFKRLTGAGREFLRSAKDEQIWTRTKRNFIRPGLFFSLSLIAEYLRQKEQHVVTDDFSGAAEQQSA
jgi:hypothetical protein